MAIQVKWTENALAERKVILAYWIERNKSKEYSYKLDGVFKKAVELISMHPHVGRPTIHENIRVKRVVNYLIIYEYSENGRWFFFGGLRDFVG